VCFPNQPVKQVISFQQYSLNMGACGCVLGVVHHTFFSTAMTCSSPVRLSKKRKEKTEQ